jgi:hydroxymethylglutaryl-CoA lyase
VTRLELRDVCPRDGLQDYSAPVPTEQKLEIVRRLHRLGIRSIEVTSFVSPKLVPQLGDAAELMAAVRADEFDDAVFSAFVATQGGCERAVAAGVDEISTTVPATDGMTQANFRRDSEAMLQEVAAIRRDHPTQPMSVTIAVAFGCPFDGRVPAERVTALAEGLAVAGYDRILLGDTIGVGNPRQVSQIFRTLAERLPTVAFGGHFHDARGAGIANVVAAVDAGAAMIDSALAGMGGCPFAPGAAGNVATEDVVWLLHDMGYDVGVDPEAAADSARWLREMLAVPARSRTPDARRFEWERGRSASAAA